LFFLFSYMQRNDQMKNNKHRHKNLLLLNELKLVHKKNRTEKCELVFLFLLTKKFIYRIHVAKIAPEQPVQEQLISAGLRFDGTGHLLPYSILGTVNDYVSELSEIEATQVESFFFTNLNTKKKSFQLSSTNNDRKTPEDIPELKTYEKRAKRPTGSPDGGGRSLQNWKFRMDERRQVMKTMSSNYEKQKLSERIIFFL